jgi:hypothetical protein
MEKLAADMVFLERSSSTKLGTGISFSSVILTDDRFLLPQLQRKRSEYS